MTACGKDESDLEGRFRDLALPGLNRALVHDLATGRFVEEKVAATTTCRTLQYTVNAEGKREQQNVKACQAADGAWELT